MKQEIKPIKMKYKQLAGGEEFSMMLQKIGYTPTSNKNACHINRIMKALQTHQTALRDGYQSKLIPTYVEKGEDGKAKFDPKTGEMVILADKREEFTKAEAEFMETEVLLAVKPLTPSVLADIKLSARDIDLLGPLFSEEDESRGPGVPLKLADL